MQTKITKRRLDRGYQERKALNNYDRRFFQVTLYLHSEFIDKRQLASAKPVYLPRHIRKP